MSLHHDVCACIKEDIPEVELVIAILTPLLEAWWLELIEEILRQGELIIDGNIREQLLLSEFRFSAAIEDEIVAAIEKVLNDRIQAMPSALLRVVEQARDQLLWDALLAAGLSGTQAELIEVASGLEAGLGPLRAAAVADLGVLMAGRITTRLPDIQSAIRKWIRAVRSDAGAFGPANVPTETFPARDSLERILGAQDAKRWIAFSADQWGYRWFTIWNALDDLAGGALFFQAVAVRDGRTTPFCKWVHGRLISSAKIRDQIRNHIRASMKGDIAALMANWPLMDSATARAEGPGADAAFGRAFAGRAMPPYHGRCRTTVRPFRI